MYFEDKQALNVPLLEWTVVKKEKMVSLMDRGTSDLCLSFHWQFTVTLKKKHVLIEFSWPIIRNVRLIVSDFHLFHFITYN